MLGFELPSFVLGEVVVRPYAEHSHPVTLILAIAVRRAARLPAVTPGEQRDTYSSLRQCEVR